MNEQLLVWWLSENACLAIGDVPLASLHVPEYLRRQFRIRSGRPGGLRLWIDEELKAPDDFCVDDALFDDTVIGRWLTRDRAGGIVIRAKDARTVTCLPGLVTDTELRPVVAPEVNDYDRLVAVFGKPDERRGVWMHGDSPNATPPADGSRPFHARWNHGPGGRDVGDFFEIEFDAGGKFGEITNP